MEKVKQEVFSNFNYGIIKSIDNRCVDVKCTYNYKGKTLTHYFSYAKQGNKSNSYYIDRAKADMAKLIKDKKAESVAKKDLNGSKATFFKRHKKPILIATTAVLVAGIATAATLITLKYTGNDPTAVTEAEIDQHLVFPKTELKTIYDKTVIENVLTKAIAKVVKKDEPFNEDSYDYDITSSSNIKNMTGLTIKRMGPFGAKVPDPFDYADVLDVEEFAGKEERLSTSSRLNNFTSSTQEITLGKFNDTTEFYTNESFKTKNLNSVYAKIDVKNSPTYTLSHIINTYDEIVEGNPVKSVYLSDNIITQKKDKNDVSKVFEVGKTTVDGVQTQDLSSVLFTGETEGSCDDYINSDITSQVVYYADLKQLLFDKAYMFAPTFYQSGEKDMYAIHFEPYVTSVNIPSVYFPPIYDDPTQPPVVEGGVKGYISPRHIWHFVNDDNLGWILKSYAMDTSTYTEFNDRYERLPNPITVNKVKGYVEFNYGERASAKKDVDALAVPELDPSEVKAPSLPVTGINVKQYVYDEDYGNNNYATFDLTDITISSRMSSEDDSYIAAGTMYIPTAEELSWAEVIPPEFRIRFDVGSVYFEEKTEKNIAGAPGKAQRALRYPVQKYNVEDFSESEYFEIAKGSDGSSYLALKKDKDNNYKALGCSFNVIVTYKNEPLQMYTPDQAKGKTTTNWILAPQSIKFNLVK